jgi:hypothetical protein
MHFLKNIMIFLLKIDLPTTAPMYTTDPSLPIYTVLYPNALPKVVFNAGMRPWSVLAINIVINRITNNLCSFLSVQSSGSESDLSPLVDESEGGSKLNSFIALYSVGDPSGFVWFSD